jgi:hypothetical protein
VPRRDDIDTILVIGSGPIVIGQACEFDYSGTQACKALREEGYRVVLLNSNPATIMTDPDMADRTYVEPMTAETVAKIIEAERPEALLPTIGGQTGLNLAVELAETGVLDRFEVSLIGAQLDAIMKAEDRDQFREAMKKIGLSLPVSGYAHSLEEGRKIVLETGIPAIIRPSFTLGGTGGSVAFTEEEFEPLVEWALHQSPRHECLIERSVLGWKEYELEVMRDGADNVVIICSIENFDAMGVHTGDCRPGPDAHGPRISGDAGRGRGHHSRDRRRHRGVEHPVCGQSRRRVVGGDRDEPARLQVVGPGIEGDRLPHREDCRQAPARLQVVGPGIEGDRLPHREDCRQARRRIHPRRDPQ